MRQTISPGAGYAGPFAGLDVEMTPCTGPFRTYLVWPCCTRERDKSGEATLRALVGSDAWVKPEYQR